MLTHSKLFFFGCRGAIKTECCHDINVVVTGGTSCYLNDNLWCRQWKQSITTTLGFQCCNYIIAVPSHERYGVSNHRLLDFRSMFKNISKLRILVLCERNPLKSTGDRRRNRVVKLHKNSIRNYFTHRCHGNVGSKNFHKTIKPFLSTKQPCYSGSKIV